MVKQNSATPWQSSCIKDIARISTGSKNTEDKVDGGSYPFFVRSDKVERINSYSYDEEAVLTAGDGVGTGKIFHYINGKYELHQRVYRIYDFSDLIFPKFFYWFFSFSFYDRIMQMTAKSSVDSVRREMIADMLCPCPPLPEQKAIAEALFDIDHLIAATEKLIAKKKDIKKSLMQELLTGKRRVITGATEKVKASELGEIPVDWDVLKISDVFRFITNNTHSRSAMNANGGKYRNIHYGDILTKYNEIVDCTSDEIPFLNVDIAVRENALLHTGDVVIADTAEDEAVGKVVEILNADKFAICSGLHTVALRPKERIFAHGFLGYFMNSEIFHSSLLPYVTGIKVSSISKTTIKNAFVLCPPMEEQAVIVSSLRDIDKDINSQILKLYKLQKLKSGMMSELLTGRIRLKEARDTGENNE